MKISIVYRWMKDVLIIAGIMYAAIEISYALPVMRDKVVQASDYDNAQYLKSLQDKIDRDFPDAKL